MNGSYEHQPLGALLRSLREKRAYSLRQLEKKAYLGKSLLERYEQGAGLPPSKQTIDCLVKALRCSEREAYTLECVWLFELLVSRGVSRERANSIVFGSENSSSTIGIDTEQVVWSAREAIAHDAYERALNWLKPIQNIRQTLDNMFPVIEYLMGEAKYGSGHFVEASEYFKHTLQLLGYPHPRTKLQQFLVTYYLIACQIWYRISAVGISIPRGFANNIYDNNNRKMIVDIYYRLSYIYYINNQRWLAIYYSLKGLNMAEAAPLTNDSRHYQALFYANVATATGTSGMHSLAKIYITCIKPLEKYLDNPHVDYRVNLVIGVYFFGRAMWKDCVHRFERAVRIAEEVGSLRHARESEAFLASAYYWQGRFDQSFVLFDYLYKKSKQSGDHQIMALGIYSKALRAFHQNKLDYALKFALIAENLANEKLHDYLVQIQVNGLLLKIYSCLNNLDKAHQHAEIIEGLSHITATTAGTLEGYYQLTEFYLRGWETFGTKEFKNGARRAIKIMASITAQSCAR